MVRADVRFQVNLPSPSTLTWATIHEDARGEIESAFERAIAREVRQLVDSIPHAELTIGFDIPVEIVTLEGGTASGGRSIPLRTRSLPGSSVWPT